MRLGRDYLLRELELLPLWKMRKFTPSSDMLASSCEENTETLKVAPAVPVESCSIAESSPVTEFDEHKSKLVMLPNAGSQRVDSILQMDWQSLKQCVSTCEACQLAKTRLNTVFGVGDPAAEWLFIGEAPGAQEDQQGEPFVGQAGKLLDNMLQALALKRGQNVFIANIVKCRPPGNRDPQAEEIAQCAPFLKRQIELIKPKLIVALGRVAAQSLLNTQEKVGALRNKQHDFHNIPVVVTYHPAYLLRNLPDKAKAWEDLCYAKRFCRN